MNYYFIFIALFFGVQSLQAQPVTTQKKQANYETVYVWQGKFIITTSGSPKEIPVTLRYQKGDHIPGLYHKQLLVGTLKNIATGESHRLIGYEQHQLDSTFHFYEFTSSGYVEHTILAGTNSRKMEGYLYNPAKGDISGAMELHRKDTLAPSVDFRVQGDAVFGHYQYDFGPGQPEGHLTVTQNEDGSVNFRIYAQVKDGGGEVEVDQDSINFKGASFSFDAKAFGVTIWSAKVQFYKGFAVVGFINSDADGEKYGEQATAEGIFIKQK